MILNKRVKIGISVLIGLLIAGGVAFYINKPKEELIEATIAVYGIIVL